MLKKIALFGLPMIMLILFGWACGKDDDPTPNPEEQNSAPIIEAQTVELAEDRLPGEIKSLSAKDDDGDILTFSLTGDSPFVISTTGVLSLSEGQSLDYETTPKYELNVTVRDKSASASATLTINVTNVNEPPTFTEETFQFGVSEDQNDTDVFGTIGVTDPEGGELSFEITDNPNSLFTIDASGQLRVANGKTLDFEAFNGDAPEYHLMISVTDNEGLVSTIVVNVTLANSDEFPYFNEENYDVTVNEDITYTNVITTVAATDPDGGALEYSFAINDNGIFTIDPTTGTIKLAEGKILDFEAFNGEDPIHHITVQAKDTSGNMVQMVVAVTVADVDEDPTFGEASYEFNPLETITHTDVIGQVTAIDPQEDTIIYSLVDDANGVFEVDANGNISLKQGQALNFESEVQQYEITLIAADPQNNSTEVAVTINVVDVNEAPFLTNEDTNIPVEENITDDYVIATLLAEDPEGGNVTFTLIDDANGVFEMSNGIISLIQGQNLDFELNPNSYELTVQISDGTNERDYVLNIQVQNVNEVPEVADQFNFEAVESINHEINLGIIEAQDPDGANLSFEVLGNNTLFEVDANGNLSLIQGQNLDFEGFPNHQITVQVSDGDLTTDTQVNIAVTNSFADLDTPFITTWRTTTSNEEVRIGIRAEYAYNFSIDWGDGNIEDFDFNNHKFISHIYDTPGDYAVAILGDFPALYPYNIPQFNNKLIGINQWGDNLWQTMEYAFASCWNLAYYNVEQGDTPNLTVVTDMFGMFGDAAKFNGDLSGWDVQNVQIMTGVFYGASSFEGIGLETWDTQNVTSMASMFRECESFDKDLGSWNIQNIIVMTTMFLYSNMSVENYSATLIGWATLDMGEAQIPENVNFQGLPGGLLYCNQAVQARSDLEALGWEITGDAPTGQDCNF
jgi:surface protein